MVVCMHARLLSSTITVSRRSSVTGQMNFCFWLYFSLLTWGVFIVMCVVFFHLATSGGSWVTTMGIAFVSVWGCGSLGATLFVILHDKADDARVTRVGYVLGTARSAGSVVRSRWGVMVLRYRGEPCAKGCRTGRGLLCARCEEMVATSKVLLGSWSLRRSRTEYYEHWSLQELRLSAPDCNLCGVLLSSMQFLTPGVATLSSDVSALDTSFLVGEERLVIKIQEDAKTSDRSFCFISSVGAESAKILIKEGRISI